MDRWRAQSLGRIVDGRMDRVVDEWIRPQSPDGNGGQIWSGSEWGCGQMDVDADGIGGRPDRGQTRDGVQAQTGRREYRCVFGGQTGWSRRVGGLADQ